MITTVKENPCKSKIRKKRSVKIHISEVFHSKRIKLDGSIHVLSKDTEHAIKENESKHCKRIKQSKHTMSRF